MRTHGTRPEMSTVIARYESMEGARDAALALTNHGVDDADVRLAGPRAAVVASQMATRSAARRSDGRLVRHAAKTVATGVLVGAGLGAVAGALVAAVVVVATDLAPAGGVFASIVIIGALLGAVSGGFIRFERSVGVDDTWELLLDDVDGEICLAVRVDDDESIEHVVDTLQEQGPPTSCELRDSLPDGAHRVLPLS